MKRSNAGKYFIQEHLQEPYLNGGIGYTDIEKILLLENYQPIFFPCHFNTSFFAKLRRLLYLVVTLLKLPRNAVVVFLYPQYAVLNRTLVRCLGWRSSIRRVAILGDINGIKHANATLLQKEIEQFRLYDFLILHNETMRHWISRQMDKPAAVIHFFDFLSALPDRESKQGSGIAYAGSLDEALFLEKADKLNHGSDLHFNVYGQPFTEKMQQQASVQYMGLTSPYELPDKLRGAYGLIWYGEDLQTIAEPLGTYLQLISPHKASLYIVCGIPLIVKSGTAIATLVQQYGIGISIDSLFELEAVLAKVSPGDYAGMCHRCRLQGREIAAGNGLRNALQEMEKLISASFSLCWAMSTWLQ